MNPVKKILEMNGFDFMLKRVRQDRHDLFWPLRLPVLLHCKLRG
jgi:hypothetical protein